MTAQKTSERDPSQELRVSCLQRSSKVIVQ